MTEQPSKPAPWPARRLPGLARPTTCEGLAVVAATIELLEQSRRRPAPSSQVEAQPRHSLALVRSYRKTHHGRSVEVLWPCPPGGAKS
jgi:hypothetical protein